MSHKAIRRLSIIGCLALCVTMSVLALRNGEAPATARAPKLSVPPPVVVVTPEPEPEVSSPPPRPAPRPSAPAKPEGRKPSPAPHKAESDVITKDPDTLLLDKIRASAVEDLQAPPQRMLGITPEALGEEEGGTLGLLPTQGAIRVQGVIPDSVAAGIGLQQGDIVTGLDGYALPRGREVEILKATMSSITPKRIAALTVVRGGVPMTLYPAWDN